jgi:hypothetical protein
MTSTKQINIILADVEALGVAGEKTLALTVYLVGVSRLLARPLAMIVQGQSSSGKSYIIEKIAELFPPEAVLHAKQMTPQALFHMPRGSLEHRWIVAGERSRIEGDDAAEATRALREMISSGKLSKLMPEKGEDGAIVTRHIEQKGPVAYIESTTLHKIFDEDANRCIMFLDRLAKALAGSDVFSTREACKSESASDRAVGGWLKELSDAGYLDQVEAGRGRNPAKWKFSEAPPTNESSALLPAPEALQ